MNKSFAVYRHQTNNVPVLAVMSNGTKHEYFLPEHHYVMLADGCMNLADYYKYYLKSHSETYMWLIIALAFVIIGLVVAYVNGYIDLINLLPSLSGLSSLIGSIFILR